MSTLPVYRGNEVQRSVKQKSVSNKISLAPPSRQNAIESLSIVVCRLGSLDDKLALEVRKLTLQQRPETLL